jgi:hypothetical protein
MPERPRWPGPFFDFRDFGPLGMAARLPSGPVWTVGRSIPDRAAALRRASDPQVSELLSLGLWTVAGHPPDRDQTRSPRVAWWHAAGWLHHDGSSGILAASNDCSSHASPVSTPASPPSGTRVFGWTGPSKLGIAPLVRASPTRGCMLDLRNCEGMPVPDFGDMRLVLARAERGQLQSQPVRRAEF